MSARILAFSGSSRRGSLNGRLLAAAVMAAEAAGGEVTLVNLGELALPLYDGDLEDAHGMPAAAARLKRLFIEHDALLIASPEYNSFFSPMLKNAIDWVSRPGGDTASPFAGKVAALVAASPGALGGIRGLPHVRLLLSNLGVTVLPGQLGVPKADQAFAADGRLADAQMQKSLEQVVGELVRVTSTLKSRRT